MARLMGPVLSFRGYDEAQGTWDLTALVVTSGLPGNLQAAGRNVEPVELWRRGERAAYRYTFSFPVAPQPSIGRYSVFDTTYEVQVPAAGELPSMAYGSCNGFSSMKLMKGVREKNCLWRRMRERHEEAKYNLLLLGGDQVYADSMWETVPSMKSWNGLGYDEGNEADFTEEMKAELDHFYFDLYTCRWSQPEVAEMMARVPALAMWDDHDIVDGWGSYPEPRQNSPVFGGIWSSASKAFAVFQQHLGEGERRPGSIGENSFTFGYKIGPRLAVLALDMRSHRSSERVIASSHWNDIYRWLDSIPEGGHLILMSSIPVVYPGFDTLETLLGVLPGHQELEDDLRDHWNSRPHKGERLRLVHRLLRVARRGVRPTIVSGDVHVAALGIIQSLREPAGSQEIVINQLISSGIVHPGPGAVVLFALRHLFDSSDEIDRGIVARMMQFPGNTAKFVGGRNYLSLEPDREDDAGRIWANWFVEGEEHPYTKVIHGVPRREATANVAA